MSDTMTFPAEYMEAMHKVFASAEQYRALQKMRDGTRSPAVRMRLEQYQQELRFFLYGHIGSRATEELLGLPR